ncbi:hypothetical protein CsSME_00019232 [Camellia sinensis var. sinensis]
MISSKLPLNHWATLERCHGLPCKANSVTFCLWWCDHLSAQEWPLEGPQRGLTLPPSSPRQVGHQQPANSKAAAHASSQHQQRQLTAITTSTQQRQPAAAAASKADFWRVVCASK